MSASRTLEARFGDVWIEGEVDSFKRHGPSGHLYFNLMPIQDVYDRWTDEYGRFWAGHVSDLKDRLESRAAPTRKAEKRA